MNDNDLELHLLVEAIYLKYGYDFRNYAKGSLKRRVMHRKELARLKTISEMIHKVIHERRFFETLILDLSINVTAMFRDPSFYLALQKEANPYLRTYPSRRIWIAGCSAGQEVYSLAILLKEEGLYECTQIYATDFNEVVVHQAKQGIYPMDQIQDYTKNYQQAGGKESFSNYYTARYGSAEMDKSLKKNVVFATHNLATDRDFNEMHLITCRNVMIYFEQELQNRVLETFYNSLVEEGFLGLDQKESLHGLKHQDAFEEVVPHEKIYRKKRK